MTQESAILATLKRGGVVTPASALRLFGCFRLAARIHHLRSKGHDIRSELLKVPSGARVARYWLKEAK